MPKQSKTKEIDYGEVISYFEQFKMDWLEEIVESHDLCLDCLLSKSHSKIIDALELMPHLAVIKDASGTYTADFTRFAIKQKSGYIIKTVVKFKPAKKGAHSSYSSKLFTEDFYNEKRSVFQVIDDVCDNLENAMVKAIMENK